VSSPAKAGDPVNAVPVIDPKGRGVLDAPLSRGTTTELYFDTYFAILI
jgi:hypothetical protein